MIDFIGDIHGHADELEELLKQLGYSIKDGAYRHSGRTVIFVGDYIDRGPKIVETLNIVRRMVDSGNAIALMGNHEYNAICFHTTDENGKHLRPHTSKNIDQHKRTMEQFAFVSKDQTGLKEYIEWFKTLPLFYEGPGFRAVHACWDVQHISFLKETLADDRLNDDLVYESGEKKNKLYKVIDETLKGKEVRMPAGQTFLDKDNHERTDVRIKWWEDPVTTTYRDLSFPRVQTLPDELIDPSLLKTSNYYTDNVPVFFGHYWLQGKPIHYGSNICCLDYSVAKDGVLTAYQFDGEAEIDIKKFVTGINPLV
jgi:hypothetical protein